MTPILVGGPRGPVGLSVEDFAIWYERRRRLRLSWWQDVQLVEVTRQCDAREALLMRRLQEARVACDRAGVLHCLIAYDGLAVDGFDDPDISLAEQGLALRLPKLPDRYR